MGYCGKYTLRVSCDYEGCEKTITHEGVPATRVWDEVKGMGWKVGDGKDYCPAHAHPTNRPHPRDTDVRCNLCSCPLRWVPPKGDGTVRCENDDCPGFATWYDVEAKRKEGEFQAGVDDVDRGFREEKEEGD